MKKIFLSLCLVFAVFVINAQTNYYINAATGSNDNDGTSADKAWKNLNGKADVWRIADCVLNIADGEYIIDSKINLAANIQIVGTGKDKVFLMGATDDDFEEDRQGNKPFTNSGFFDVSGDKTVTIKNLTMKNLRLGDSEGTIVWGGFITVQSGNKLVMNTVDILKGELPVGGGAGIDCKGTLELTNVTIADCIADRQGVAISFNNTVDAKFEGCVFSNNTGASTINAYLPEVTDGLCGDLSFNNCLFENNDYSKAQYGACVFLGNFYGKKLKYHITNSTFSENLGHSAGVLFITTSMDKTREIDMLVANSTFMNNNLTTAVHGTVYSMNASASNTISGDISFVNNTFYHNDRPEGVNTNSSDIFFQDMSVNFNLINNIFLTDIGSYGTVLNYNEDATKNCNPTIKGNIFERVGGGVNELTNIANDASLNMRVGQEQVDPDPENEELGQDYIDGNTLVKLETTLTEQGGYKAPYLKLSEGSVAIDYGVKDSPLVPALDVRGQAVYNDKKDAGAYEYDGTMSSVSTFKTNNIFAYMDYNSNAIVLSETLVSISIYSITGSTLKTIKNSSSIDVSNIPSGIYLLKIVDSSGLVSSIKVQK